MKHCLKCILAAVAIGTAGGVSIAGLGLIDVGAASGHYAITEWALHGVMRASVRTAALGVEAPKAQAPVSGMTVAAVHFERACSICHGSPRRERSPEILAMLPPPPDLSVTIGSWSAEELFIIVRDGIRYTGMPAWPASERDDEVWTMVGFLKALPGLDSTGYAKLLNEDRRDNETGRNCAQCHNGNNSLAPSFSDQSETYIRNSLTGYLERKRSSGIMQVAVAGLTPRDVAALARASSGTASSCRIQRKASMPSLISHGDAQRKIPACIGCHDGQRPDYPVLGGLPAAYIANQLALFRQSSRGQSPNEERMMLAARNLSDEDIRIASNHFSSQATRSGGCEP